MLRGAVWRQGCKTGGVPLAVLRDRVREFVEAAPEQLRPGPPEIPAIGIADEAEATVRSDPGDELVLGVDHRAVARLAGGQPVERLPPLRQRAGDAIEQGVDGPRQPAELVALMAWTDRNRQPRRRLRVDRLDRGHHALQRAGDHQVRDHGEHDAEQDGPRHAGDDRHPGAGQEVLGQKPRIELDLERPDRQRRDLHLGQHAAIAIEADAGGQMLAEDPIGQPA